MDKNTKSLSDTTTNGNGYKNRKNESYEWEKLKDEPVQTDKNHL